MKKTIFFLFAGLFLMSCSGPRSLSESELKERNYQELTDFAAENKILPDQYPMYPNGGMGLIRDIKKEQVYPQSMKNRGIKGTVRLTYTVDKKGRVKDINITSSLHPNLDAEAIRVMKSLTDFYPAKFKGKYVDCNLLMPFYFDPDAGDE